MDVLDLDGGMNGYARLILIWLLCSFVSQAVLSRLRAFINFLLENNAY